MNRAMMMHVRDKSKQPEHGEMYDPYSNSYYTPQRERHAGREYPEHDGRRQSRAGYDYDDRDDEREYSRRSRGGEKYPEYDDPVWMDDDDNRRTADRRESREGRDRTGNRQAIRAGGTFWMDTPGKSEEMTRETAEKWVAAMHNEDPEKPKGGKWTPDEIRPLAQKYSIPTEGPAYWEFYAMVNAMYSDYSEVAKKFGVKTPDFFAEMAKAWLNDKDARDDKTEVYYRDIVKK